ncbi:c-type cytochrome [Elizabethkingia anophelis]|uniref:cytochrome-c peroxidase n=1 Tax=Elizabethkingia anophelis TaxID=1117645 RepID=UPI001626BFAF|nr:c-type cytochrome [Elizabethkingia anophelis]MCT3679234.1 c-type cytochrome [Elizabethkingia anophelis]MCT3703204.1 c-type cytochrome [Elizabethkingia anophelis]MCT3769462.1 c-type cytochrome [Elizabethkingia anophelis]MCT3779365.1 c-type cytochrome [Elizabethkingia anophelis]
MRKFSDLKLVLLLAGLAFFFMQYTIQRFSIDYGEVVEQYKQPSKYWPKPIVDPSVQWKELEAIEQDSNYYETQELPEVVLGKKLFFDPKLSASSQISCSSCHNPELGWADRQEVALGNDHLQGKRNTQSLFNIAERESFFWDGRAKTLEEQLVGPISAHNEMNMKPEKLAAKLAKYTEYRKLFREVYQNDHITFDKIAKALATFQRTIRSQPSKLDKFIKGDYKALSDKEIYGMHVFRTKAGCMNCHYGKYMTDESFHNIGLTYYKREYEDLGRYNITKDPDDTGKFKTPSLRDLAYTAPWMHNGLMDDLYGIVNLYNSGMQMINPTQEEKKADPKFPVTDHLIKPLKLNEKEIDALVAFLESISGSYYKMPRPEIPRK